MKISRNYLIFGLLSLSLVFIASNCNDDESDPLLGNWSKLSSFEGDARFGAVAFTIGDLSYIGTGYNGEDYLSDFWSFDAERNSWSQVAVFPGEARIQGVAFAAAGIGYVGTGWTGTARLSDFYGYDPETNSWEEVADFVDPLKPASQTGTARYGAVAFSVNDIGYVGTGYDGNYLKDFYAYDPVADTWTKKLSLTGNKRRYAVAFVINDKGYVCAGIENNTACSDFFEYDPTDDTWTQKRSISNISDESYDDKYTIIRNNAVAFVINGKGYVAAGTNNGLKKDTWEYDPSDDLWIQRTNFEGSERIGAVAFSTSDNTRGFVATGRIGDNSNSYFDDIWELKPLDTYDKVN